MVRFPRPYLAIVGPARRGGRCLRQRRRSRRSACAALPPRHQRSGRGRRAIAGVRSDPSPSPLRQPRVCRPWPGDGRRCHGRGLGAAPNAERTRRADPPVRAVALAGRERGAVFPDLGRVGRGRNAAGTQGLVPSGRRERERQGLALHRRCVRCVAGHFVRDGDRGRGAVDRGAHVRFGRVNGDTRGRTWSARSRDGAR